MSAATEAAREAGADLLIAVGGGSVIIAARAVAIFMAEPGDPFQIMTQYPEGRPAYSPRLAAAKPPIINVPTTPNSAMNRAGTALKNPDLDHRMEYFDPKTRPHSIFLDEEALLGAPPHLIRSTAATVFASSSRRRRKRTSIRWSRATTTRPSGCPIAPARGCRTSPTTRRCSSISASRPSCATAPRTTACRRLRGGTFSGSYAVSTALHIRYPQVGQGESTSVIHSAKIRLSETVDAQAAQQVAEALEVWRDGMDGRQAALAVADRLDALYARSGCRHACASSISRARISGRSPPKR